MAGQIITARHGRPNVDRSVKISAREYGVWWQNYDLSGLAPDQEPPQALVDVAAEAEIIISSTMPRAIETAAKVVDNARMVPQDALFVEAPLPPPPIPLINLNPTTWGVVSRSFWFWGYAPDGVESHSQARKRVAKVTDRLIEYALRDENVLLCAHGYLNWMIDRHIAKRGWKKVRHEGGNNYWSFRVYEQTEEGSP